MFRNRLISLLEWNLALESPATVLISQQFLKCSMSIEGFWKIRLTRHASTSITGDLAWHNSEHPVCCGSQPFQEHARMKSEGADRIPRIQERLTDSSSSLVLGRASSRLLAKKSTLSAPPLEKQWATLYHINFSIFNFCFKLKLSSPGESADPELKIALCWTACN